MLEVLKEVLGLEEKSCEVAFENKDSAVLKTQKDLGTGGKVTYLFSRHLGVLVSPEFAYLERSA